MKNNVGCREEREEKSERRGRKRTKRDMLCHSVADRSSLLWRPFIFFSLFISLPCYQMEDFNWCVANPLLLSPCDLSVVTISVIIQYILFYTSLMYGMA